jgi:hypothetical protein
MKRVAAAGCEDGGGGEEEGGDSQKGHLLIPGIKGGIMKRTCMVLSIECILILMGNIPSHGQLFDIAVNYDAGDGSYSIISADLNADFYSDLAVANQYSDNVSILLNNGDGTFQAAINYGVGGRPSCVFAADLDGDGDSDLAVPNVDSDNVSILKNNGDGTFQAAVNYSVGDWPASIHVADLDGDGDSDLAVTNWRGSSFSILKNTGDGTFQAAVNYSAGSWPNSVFAADFDGDGDNDLAMGKASTASYISIFKNNGDGTFQPAVNYGTGTGPRWVIAADLDNDGDNDLATVNGLSDYISILENNGNGTFQPAVNYNVGGYSTCVFSVDIDGDEDKDLAVTHFFSNYISILLNIGDGTFQSAINFIVGDGPGLVFATDLDNDGDSDLAVGNNHSDNVSILMNLTINVGSVCVFVNSNNGSPVQGVTVTVIDENNDPISTPQQTDELGTVIFDPVDVGVYSVMIVTPLGYSVSPSETQTNVMVTSGQCSNVDFVLTPSIISNDCRTIGYWKHQFNVYTSGRGNAQESSTDLETYLDLVHQHFNILGIYVDLENFDFEDAKNVLTVRGSNNMLDRAKQQLFSMLLNFASDRVGNETVISDDNRVAAEAVTFVAALINDGLPDNDEQAKTICDKINNGQLVEAGVIPVSNIRYKLASDGTLPIDFSVAKNFPNPFNAQTSIQYGLPRTSDVVIEIYDLLGRKIESVFQGKQPAGYHHINWDAAEVSSGVYFYTIHAGDFTVTRKMILIK